jgi:hypothetical protein
MNLRTWRPENPVATGLAVTALAALAGYALAKDMKRRRPDLVPGPVWAGSAAAGILAFLIHDKWVDGMPPFNLWPFCRVPYYRM